MPVSVHACASPHEHLLLVSLFVQEEQARKREQELLLEKEQREIKLNMMLQTLQVQCTFRVQECLGRVSRHSCSPQSDLCTQMPHTKAVDDILLC
jgi:hypothetical protein